MARFVRCPVACSLCGEEFMVTLDLSELCKEDRVAALTGEPMYLEDMYCPKCADEDEREITQDWEER